MENFVYEYPTKVYFGKGAAQQHLPGILASYGPNVLLAYGGGSIKRNGVYEGDKRVRCQSALRPYQRSPLVFS